MKKMYLHERWIPFSEICTNILAIYAQGDVNSRQALQTVTGRSNLVCNGHSTGLPPLLAASEALRAPEAFRGGTREGSRRKGLLLSAQDHGVKTGVEASSHPIAITYVGT